MAVGEAEVAEPTGGRVLETAQVLDLELDERRLVLLGRGAPRVERREVGGRHDPVEDLLLTRVVLEQAVPVELGPPLGFHERGGLGDGLGAELGDETGEAGDRA